MKNNNKGFSLVIAMGIVIIITLLALTVLEYIVPFSRDIKGIENSTKSYYQANTGIEGGLYKIFNRNYGGGDTRVEYNEYTTGNISYNFSTTSSGDTLPNSLEGNSDYDRDWNKISQGNPIQISIGNGYITGGGNLEVAFRVPNLDKILLTPESLSGNTLPIVNWQLSSANDTLNAGSDIIKADDVNDSNKTGLLVSKINLMGKTGKDLSGTSKAFLTFYNSYCGTSSGCTLKLSVINKLETNTVLVPYLEWQINTNSSENIPLRYTKLETSGKSYGFKKDISIRIPAQTVNEAFDFTVFQ